MIDERCFTSEWIHEQRKRLPGVDPTLLEKTILALELLGQFKKNGLSFVFKGGTCLLLLLEGFKRLSIDVDIVSETNEQSMQSVFDDIVSHSPFNRWAEDPRDFSHIPKRHYKFFFDSQINRREDYVLLDILQSANLFPAIQIIEIDLPFIRLKDRVPVTVPTIDGLIGDKLTAFAPNTIGISLEQERSMQIVKQLFDLGELFLHAGNPDEISVAYNAFVNAENRYRQTAYERQESLRDTLHVCFMISQLDLKGATENETTEIMRRGIRQLGSHLVGSSFGLTQAKIAASRIAFLSAVLLSGSPENLRILFFNDGLIHKIKDANISGQWAILNRLKPVSAESFYYWHMADKFLKR